MPLADIFIQNIYEELNRNCNQEDLEVIVAHENSYEGVFYEGVDYEDYILIRETHDTNLGALFIEDFLKMKYKEDIQIGFQALKILNKDLNILFWYQTPDWNYMSDFLSEDEETLEEYPKPKSISYQKHVDKLDDDGYSIHFSPKYRKMFYDKWGNDNSLAFLIKYGDPDYEDLYIRANEGTDCFSIWLKAILYLQSIDFNLFNYSFSMPGECECVNNYAIYVERTSKFITEYDEFMNGVHESHPGITNLAIYTPEGEIVNNLGNNVADFMYLIFAYDPTKNNFYGRIITYERFVSYTSHLNLSNRQQAILRRILRNNGEGSY